MPTTTLPYRYTHASTESMTGYFSCEPPEDLCFEDAVSYTHLMLPTTVPV